MLPQRSDDVAITTTTTNPAVIKITGMQVELDMGKVDAAAHIYVAFDLDFVRMACALFYYFLFFHEWIVLFYPLHLLSLLMELDG